MNLLNKSRAGLALLCASFIFMGACSQGLSQADSSNDSALILSALAGEPGGGALPGLDSRQENAVTSGDYEYDFLDNLWITSNDGVRIAANVFTPRTANPAEKLPTIIFVNSWALNEYEYIVQAAKFASKGYIVMSYSTRGFGFSDGYINTAGPKDLEDLSVVIDWLEANRNVDSANIGISGISYGAGISLIALAKEDRIKTAVPMSGWSDLRESLYGGESARLIWGGLLVAAGYVTGNMDPVILEQYLNILTNNNIEDVLEWADERSPIAYIDGINAKNKPVYISNNFGDNLFQPNSMLEFYAKLTGPKKLDLNQGIHATAEITGILGLSNLIWNNAHDWFDYWLKGINTGIMDKPEVSMELKFSNQRETFESWPSNRVSDKTLYLKPRGWFSNGSLKTSQNTSSKNTKIYSGLGSGASAGIPLLSPIVESHLDLPVIKYINAISRTYGVVYESSRFYDGLKLRGAPRLDVWVTPSGSKAQIVCHLYDVDWWGYGKLITHGTVSMHNATPGQSVKKTCELVAAAYDLPDGHKLALALDTFDLLYDVPTLTPYSLTFNHSSSKQSTLSLPGIY